MELRYNVETSRMHNRLNWSLQLRMDLKTAAMKSLPANQLAYAMNVSEIIVATRVRLDAVELRRLR